MHLTPKPYIKTLNTTPTFEVITRCPIWPFTKLITDTNNDNVTSNLVCILA